MNRYRARSRSIWHDAIQGRGSSRSDEAGPGVPVKAGQASISGQDGGRVSMMTDPGSRVRARKRERESRLGRPIVRLREAIEEEKRERKVGRKKRSR